MKLKKEAIALCNKGFSQAKVGEMLGLTQIAVCRRIGGEKRRQREYTYTREYRKKYPWSAKWSGAKQRHRKFNYGFSITVSDVKEVWFRDEAWKLKVPSLDRINSKSGYHKDNILFIETLENVRLGAIEKRGIPRTSEVIEKIRNTKLRTVARPVVQLTLEGKFINKYISVSDMCRKMNSKSPIHCLIGKQKTSLGYKWIYAND